MNGEPFTKYCLRQIYPFAHEIIVAEGAVEGAESIATDEGHSIDGTWEVLHRFKKEEDPDDKLIIVKHSGFWFDKNEQSKAYSQIATGDYLWQIDIDEFYRHEDIKKVLGLLAETPDISAISFPTITFWGSPEYRCDSWMLIRNNYYEVFRIFKWGYGYKYKTHIPPTVFDDSGRNLRKLRVLNGNMMRKLDIWMYHYSLLFPKQVELKGIYYSSRKNRPKVEGWEEWMLNSYFSLKKPFKVHNVFRYPGWLERFSSQHPEQIEQMWKDIHSGVIDFPTRQTEDVEGIIDSIWYRTGIRFLKLLEPIDNLWRKVFWNRIKWHLKYSLGFHRNINKFKQKHKQ
ncbi:MAG: glycosyltransferase [Candidatus Aegiribacteria sp.]|nr:glycosyltransferase [Candidatus Aegiribacteria sp.]